MSVILIDRSFIFLVKTLVIIFTFSSNNDRGRLFPFWHQKGAIIRGRRLLNRGTAIIRGNTVYLRAISF